MPNRIIKETICTSDTIDLLDAEEERLFYRLLTRADDHGRFDGRVVVILASCYPLKVQTLPVESVEAWLSRLEEVGLVVRYEVDGRPYIYLPTWSKHQRMRQNASKFPDPHEVRLVAWPGWAYASWWPIGEVHERFVREVEGG